MKNKLIGIVLEAPKTSCVMGGQASGKMFQTAENIVDHLLAAGVTIPVRCRHCEFHHWEQEPCHGKTEHFCSVLNAQVFPDFYCYHGKLKEG